MGTAKQCVFSTYFPFIDKATSFTPSVRSSGSHSYISFCTVLPVTFFWESPVYSNPHGLILYHFFLMVWSICLVLCAERRPRMLMPAHQTLPPVDSQLWNSTRRKKKKSSHWKWRALLHGLFTDNLADETFNGVWFLFHPRWLHFLFILGGCGSALVPANASVSSGCVTKHPTFQWLRATITAELTILWVEDLGIRGQSRSLMHPCSVGHQADGPACGEWLAVGWGDANKRLFMSHITVGCLFGNCMVPFPWFACDKRQDSLHSTVGT